MNNEIDIREALLNQSTFSRYKVTFNKTQEHINLNNLEAIDLMEQAIMQFANAHDNVELVLTDYAQHCDYWCIIFTGDNTDRLHIKGEKVVR